MDLSKIYPKHIVDLFKECAALKALQKVDGCWLIPFGCAFQVCLPDGLSLAASGSPVIFYGKYLESKKSRFRGEPGNAWSLKDKLFIVHFYNGIEVCGEGLVKITEQCVLVIRRDEMAGDKIIRRRPRLFQLPDGSDLEDHFKI